MADWFRCTATLPPLGSPLPSGHAARDGIGFLFLGYYQDEIVRLEEGWRFSRRRLLPRTMAKVPFFDGKVHDLADLADLVPFSKPRTRWWDLRNPPRSASAVRRAPTSLAPHGIAMGLRRAHGTGRAATNRLSY